MKITSVKTIAFTFLTILFALSSIGDLNAQSAKKEKRKKKKHKTEKAAQASASLTKGVVKFDVTDVKSSDTNPQMAMVVNMMKNSTMILSFDEEKTLSNMDMMGGMTQIKVLFDNKTGNSTMYMDVPMQAMKYKIPMTKAERDETQKNTPVYEYIADKTKTKQIAGYECYLVQAKDEDDNVVEIYVTDKIQTTADHPQFKGLKAFAMEFSNKRGPFTMTMAATSVLGELPADAFNISDEGYETKSIDDLKKMGGGF